jgi:4'-phosphopantetheinyl transferase
VTDRVDVWLIPVDLPGAALAALTAVLDPDEQARSAALRDAATRRRFTATHGAVRWILGERLGVPPAHLRWRYGPHGKPSLADRLEFNWSHSGEWALLAVHPDRAVGVDVQELLPASTARRMARRYFGAGAADGLAAGAAADVGDPAEFAARWARREAVVKAYGGRLLDHVGPTASLPPGAYVVHDLPVPGGYRAAVARAGNEPFVVALQPWNGHLAG